MMILFWLYVVVFLIQFVIIYGWSFAYWQGKYAVLADRHRNDDRVISMFTGISYGLLPIIGLYFAYDKAKYGWKFK